MANASETEYAKVIRWFAPTSVSSYGIRMNVTLPSAATIGGKNGNGFINFYLAASGVEAGLSSSVGQVVNNNWHWFCNGGSGDDGLYTFKAGQTHSIELSVNSSKQLAFYVDGSVKRTIGSGYGALADTRMIIAACDQDFNKTPPSPLPAWNTTHNQVVCSDIQYRNASGNWVTFTNQPNATDTFPVPKASHPHTGTPQDYVRVVSSGQIIASLKK